MGIKFFIDENYGRDLADGLRLLGYNVEHIFENFDEGVKDTVWLPYVGENKLALITKDKGIRRKPNEKALLHKYKVVAFYLGGSKQSGQNIVKQLINAWDKMEAKAKVQLKKGMAGAFRVPPRGTGKIVEIPLT